MEENRLSPVTGAIIACDATQRNKKGAVRRRRPSCCVLRSRIYIRHTMLFEQRQYCLNLC
ncbi:hypothetical protein SELSPUOL_02592 [Selenomonas sputigena ATCC 35185]|uniref:Uncharacterized protein n=1 Tax=Selenomonas sputigena (strain ATCC 35185 / DSM 20758 / CCUG 44933 / VPI D19B-28) TaxID=546271 RepID=C9LYN1_SELS3|nr:hypothetical protein SELSPUOL_02592 [Selenomonas sputigena ATCC 35185]